MGTLLAVWGFLRISGNVWERENIRGGRVWETWEEMSKASDGPNPFPITPSPHVISFSLGWGDRAVMLSGTQKDLGAKKLHPSTPANLVTKRVGFGIQPPGLNPASHVLTLRVT